MARDLALGHGALSQLRWSRTSGREYCGASRRCRTRAAAGSEGEPGDPGPPREESWCDHGCIPGRGRRDPSLSPAVRLCTAGYLHLCPQVRRRREGRLLHEHDRETCPGSWSSESQPWKRLLDRIGHGSQGEGAARLLETLASEAGLLRRREVRVRQ